MNEHQMSRTILNLNIRHLNLFRISDLVLRIWRGEKELAE